MQIVYSEAHREHHPRHFLVSGAPRPSPEVPDRAHVLLEAAVAAGHALTNPEPCSRGQIAAVHTAEYLDFLEHAAERWARIEGASEEVVPNIHPNGRTFGPGLGGYPASVVGQAGYHLADTACPISAGTWPAARAAASTAVHAARLVHEGAPYAYALCRPPGHHAFADMAGGFCFLNNSAIAAQALVHAGLRVAILDVDVHHGNGTQGIFYERDDVLTVSLHSDPIRFYPFFWGYAEERGAGRGLGANLNIPLPRDTGDEGYLKALDKALRRVAAFAPDLLVVALGLDAHESDPLQGLLITTAGFERIGRALGALALPSLLVQEGGYLTEQLGANLVSFLKGFEAGHPGT